MRFLNVWKLCFVLLVSCVFTLSVRADEKTAAPPSSPPEVSVDASSPEVILVRGGKRYLVKLDAHTVTEIDNAEPQVSSSLSASAAEPQTQSSPDTTAKKSKYYTAGDVRLINLPTANTLPRHGFLVEFTHRFFSPAFSGTALGHNLAGLDSFATASFGFQYGITSRLSAAIYRSPSTIGRPIEMRAAYKLMSEKNGQPFNAVARFSIAGLNDFTRDYTPSFELIASRSLGPRAQFYLVPTVSIHNRPLAPQILPQPCSLTTAAGFSPTSNIKPCSDTFALGVGLAVDIRPTVALLFEVNPTLAGGTELGIHRPPYGFAIQKKIYRHAFTFGVTTGPGTTIAQRIGTRAAPLGDPRGDLPSRLSIGFNLSRQLR